MFSKHRPKTRLLSAELAQTFLSALQETDKSATVTTRRLRDTALLSLEEGDISALRTQDGATTAQQEQAIALSDELITELEAADMIVIAAPFPLHYDRAHAPMVGLCCASRQKALVTVLTGHKDYYKTSR